MNKEYTDTNLVREEDLMTKEEMEAWEEYVYSGRGLGGDQLDLIPHNREISKREIGSGVGPDDGDLL